MTRVWLAVRRGLARADSLIAIAALFAAGWRAAGERWTSAVVLGAVGLVFLVASGDFVWRKGYAAGKRESSGRP